MLPDRQLRRAVLRRLLVVGVAAIGVVATTATSEVTSTTIASDETTLDVLLDASRPAVAFTITTTVQATTVQATTVGVVDLRADLRVDDDGDPANDDLHLLDVGLLDDGEVLPADVDAAGDATMASVGEGAFGVTTSVEPDAATAGVVTVLALRLRPGVTRARVTVRLAASAQFVDSADATVTIDVAPRPDEGDGTTDSP